MKAAATLLLAMALTAPSFASAQAQAAPPPTCRLDTSATVVNYNTRVRLDWQSSNATGGYLTDVGSIAPSGWAYVVPGRNTTYAASFTGPGGTVVCRAAIAVRSGGVGAPVNTNQPIDTNTPVPLTQTVDLGGNVTLPAAPSFDAPSGSGFSGGIVPAECRGRSTVANCDLCSLAQLGQNAANFLLGLSIPAAALLFAWAGIMYFSARGNTGQIQKAHTIFRSVVIGFVIAVSAWVLVITAMNMLIHGKDFQGWSWQNLDCTQTRLARRYNMSLTAFLGTLSVKYETNNAPVNGGAGGGAGGGGSLGCGQYASAYGGSIHLEGTQCVDGNNAVVGPALRSSQVVLTDAQQDALQYSCEEEGNANSCKLLNSYLDTGYNGGATLTQSQRSELQHSCKDEGDQNSCDLLDAYSKVPSAPSHIPIGKGTRGSAVCPEGNPYCSISALQQTGLSETQARAMSCIAITENSGNPVGCSGTGPCGTFQISRTNWGIYAPYECRASNFGGNLTAAQNNGECNLRTAAAMVRSQGYQPWTGNNNGVYWNTAARTCVSNYDAANLDK